MSIQEIGCKPEGFGQGLRIGRPVCAGGEEIRQGKHLAGPGRARLPTHGPARFRRDIGQIVARTGRCTFLQIQSEAEIVQQRQLEANEQLAGRRRLLEMIENHIQRLEEMRMRIPFGQQTQQ